MEMKDILSSEMAEAKIDELVARKNGIVDAVAEKRTAFESADVETRDAILDELTESEKEVESIDAEINEVRALKERFEDQEKRFSFAKTLTKEAVEERKGKMEENNVLVENRHAVAEYFRLNRALQTADAEAVIKTVLAPEIEVAWNEDYNIVDLCDIVSVRGIYSIPIEVSATDAVWHEEGADAPAEEEITLGNVLMQPMFIKKWLSLTDEVILLGDNELLSYVAREMVHKVKEQLALSIVNRNANEGVIGIVVDVDTQVGPSGNQITMGHKEAQALDFNTANRMLPYLKRVENARVLMNKATFFNNILGLTDTAQRPIYQVMTDNAGKPRYFYNGLPVEFTDGLKAFAAASAGEPYMIVADMKGYKLNLPYGRDVAILRDPYTLAPEDRERMIAKLPAAGRIGKLGCFAVVTKSA